MVIEELREYVFALFLGEEETEGQVERESLEFLGTAFFVSKRGDAVTAAHIIPSRKDLGDSQSLYGVLFRNGKEEIFKVTMAAKFEKSDFAIFKLGINDTPHFETSFDEPLMGTDVISLGVTEHDVHGQGKELRMLKGHMTMSISRGVGELNFSIPRGMSGGPVLSGDKCIGFMLGSLKSESLIEREEEITEITDSLEKITFVESKEISHYGFFRPFSVYKGHKSELFEDRSLDELIQAQNRP